MLGYLKEKAKVKQEAQRLYAEILRQSRQPEFFEKHGVPDSLTGRFELLLVHAFLAWRRLSLEGRRGGDMAQALFDAMFRDMNNAIRLSGVGDLSVPRHMKRMMQAYKGRSLAYGQALEQYEEAPELLEKALERNLFATVAVPPQENIVFFIGYIMRMQAALSKVAFEDLPHTDWMELDRNEQEKEKTNGHARMVA